MRVKKGQIYKQKTHDFFVEIIGEKGGKFRTRVLTKHIKKYGGTHTLSRFVLKCRYVLVDYEYARKRLSD